MLETTTDPIVGIAISVGVGVVLVVGAFAVLRRQATRAHWKILGAAVGVAVVATGAGLLVNLLSVPKAPPHEYSPVVAALAAVAMPGVLAMNIFGRHALDTIPYFGGFVLNVVLWAVAAYTVFRKVRRA